MSIPFLSFCQKLQFTYKSQVVINSSSQEDDFISASHDSILIYTSELKESGPILQVSKLNLNTFVQETFILRISSEKQFKGIISIEFSKDFLIVLSYDIIRVFENKNKYELVASIDNEDSYDEVHWLNQNKFLFSTSYHYHPLDQKINTRLSVYDAAQNRFIKSIIPSMDAIEYTHFTHHFVDVGKETIFFSNTLRYLIYTYDFNLNPLDTISTKKKNWISYPGDKIPFETSLDKVGAKELMSQLSRDDKNHHRIEQVYTLEDDRLIVLFREPGCAYKYRMGDIWKRIKNKWVLEVKDQKLSNSPWWLTRKNFGLSYYKKFLFTENRLIIIQMGVPEKFNVPIYLFMAKVNNYLRNNPNPPQSIYFYDFNVN